MWDLLLRNIAAKNVMLNEDEVNVLQTYFTHRKYRKHQYILQEGEVATHDNFIIKGLARTYRVDDKGQEHILRFAPEDWWTGDLASFLSEKPTIYNVDCLEDTEVLRISAGDLELMCEKVPKMNKYFRILYQKSIISFNLRLSSTLSNSAGERYDEFVKRFPQIEQRVPNHMIAAYLGITPQSLSRIRSQGIDKKN
jgi:CRP-like cAMP-binding protein